MDVGVGGCGEVCLLKEIWPKKTIEKSNFLKHELHFFVFLPQPAACDDIVRREQITWKKRRRSYQLPVVVTIRYLFTKKRRRSYQLPVVVSSDLKLFFSSWPANLITSVTLLTNFRSSHPRRLFLSHPIFGISFVLSFAPMGTWTHFRFGGATLHRFELFCLFMVVASYGWFFVQI